MSTQANVNLDLAQALVFVKEIALVVSERDDACRKVHIDKC